MNQSCSLSSLIIGNRLLRPERDEIESVLILDALETLASRQEHRIPRSLLLSVVKQLAPTIPGGLGFEGTKCVRQVSTPVARLVNRC